MIHIAQPYIDEAEKAAAWNVLDSGMLAQGQKVEEFERLFADEVGARHAVAVGNGTEALFLALLAHGIGDGDRVLTTPFSFISTATAILMTGAEVIFQDVEVDSGTMQMRPSSQEWQEASAVIPVHLYGKPAQFPYEGMPSYEPAIIFDACQAHGARYGNKPIGAYGTSCWSFYATKNMTTGEGGMVTTGSETIAHRIRMLRNHGQSVTYHPEMLGYNARMTDLQAAIGIIQLQRLEELNRKRRVNARFYDEYLPDHGIIKPDAMEADGRISSWHQYTIRVPRDRDRLLSYLHEHGVGARVYYPIPLHQTRLFRYLGYGNQQYPNAERLAREVISLPVHPLVTEEQRTKITLLIHKWAERGLL